MFTSRSASARQTLPSMLGRSSNSTINSLVIGMAGPHLPALGEDRAPSRLGCAGHEILRPRNLMFKIRGEATAVSEDLRPLLQRVQPWVLIVGIKIGSGNEGHFRVGKSCSG